MELKCLSVTFLVVLGASISLQQAIEGSSEVEVIKNPLPPKVSSAAGDSPGQNEENPVSPSDDPSKPPIYDPMTSRYAPSETSQWVNARDPYIVTDARLKEIREHFMYPYYDEGGNADNVGDYQSSIMSSIHKYTRKIHKNLNFHLPFFGFRFNYTRISLNGFLEFSDPPEYYDAYPLVFPVKDWPKRNDPSFIGIFFSKCFIGKMRWGDLDRRRPGVYFRLERDLRTRTDRTGVEMRERIKWDIREGVIGADSFDPKHLIIATWKNVTFVGGIRDASYLTNTFQMVLATDEDFTYAMFNYVNLDWTTHTEAGGDNVRGEGGIPAFVGFNAGNDTRSFEYKPYSQASEIRDLTSTGFGNGMKGRHLFRIDENILLGSCNKDTYGTNSPLVFAPESGNMLGGTVVNITGPCFESTDRVLCKFDIEIVYGVVVDRNRAICVQPPLRVEGFVRLEVTIGADTHKWKGKYYVETPATAAQKIFFDTTNYNEKNPTEIGITWTKQNLTCNEDASVRISLWGYRETSNRPEFLYITDLADDVRNTGSFEIIPSQYRDRNDDKLLDIKFGFIQINLTEPIPVVNTLTGSSNEKITPLVWSRPIPLAWYFGPQWERKYGSHWPEKLCNDWLNDDRNSQNFTHDLPECPCTLEQALTDKGRFLPDLDCDKDSNPVCYFHKPAIHCVKTGTPSLQGSEQQCCYDRNNYLMLSQDQQWGSYPRRSHDLGRLPWDESTKVPTLSQWCNDMVPRFVCCLWQEETSKGCESLRFDRRPTQDCVAYRGPAIAGVYGDPHVVTFDDLRYTFNGKGEFVLVRSEMAENRLEIQGRFERVPPNWHGKVGATRLTSVVARGNSTTVIEVRSRPREARWRYRLDVIADGRRVFFDRASLKIRHFPGVTVYTPTYIFDQSEVVVMFDSGAGLEVVENGGYLSARVFLPRSFINQTRGLMGSWSFDQSDDFTLPDGTRTPVSTSLNDFERVYNEFGLKWMLDDKEDPDKGRALFHREFRKSRFTFPASTYNDPIFEPEFRMDLNALVPENRSEYRWKAIQYCTENNHECLYDYVMTLDRDVARFTSSSKAAIERLKEVNNEKIVSCGVLKTPRFGRKDSFLFVAGTKVSFECMPGFILVGAQQRECLSSGEWNVPDNGQTECLRQQEYSQRQAGIASGTLSGIVLVVLVPLLSLFAYIAWILFKRRQDGKRINEILYLQLEAQQREIPEEIPETAA